MENISKNMLLELSYRLPVKTLYYLSLIGGDYLFDNKFWQKYCIKRNIVLSTYPWKQKVYLWEKRRPVWTILDETPWDPDSQNPKFVWGLDDNQVIEYSESELAVEIINADIQSVITNDIVYYQNGNNQNDDDEDNHITDTGFYKTRIEKILKNSVEKSVMYFVRYCPYDQCHVGYCVIEENLSIDINRSISYSGEVTDGLRQGRGILMFDNGFVVDSDDLYCDEDNDEIDEDDSSQYDITGIPWNDQLVVDAHINQDIPDLTFSMMDRLEQILEKYMYWCKNAGY